MEFMKNILLAALLIIGVSVESRRCDVKHSRGRKFPPSISPICRLRNLEKRLKAVEQSSTTNGNGLTGLEKQFGEDMTRVNNQFENLEAQGQMSKKRIDKLEDDVADIRGQLGSTTADIQALKNTVQVLKSDQDILRGRLDELIARINMSCSFYGLISTELIVPTANTQLSFTTIQNSCGTDVFDGTDLVSPKGAVWACQLDLTTSGVTPSGDAKSGKVRIVGSVNGPVLGSATIDTEADDSSAQVHFTAEENEVFNVRTIDDNETITKLGWACQRLI